MNTIVIPDFSNVSNPVARADQIRAYVVSNSVYAASAWGQQHAADVPGVLKALAAHAQGQSSYRPEILCGTRADVMLALLACHGISGRQVDIFADPVHSDLESHTFVEILVDGKWTVQDPSFNAYYTDAAGHRLSCVEVMRNPAGAVPRNETTSGWAALKMQAILSYYLGAACLGRHPAQFVLGPGFDVNRPYQGARQTFTDYVRQNFTDYSFTSLGPCEKPS